jgi:hypothetical protein
VLRQLGGFLAQSRISVRGSGYRVARYSVSQTCINRFEESRQSSREAMSLARRSVVREGDHCRRCREDAVIRAAADAADAMSSGFWNWPGKSVLRRFEAGGGNAESFHPAIRAKQA